MCSHTLHPVGLSLLLSLHTPPKLHSFECKGETRGEIDHVAEVALCGRVLSVQNQSFLEKAFNLVAAEAEGESAETYTYADVTDDGIAKLQPARFSVDAALGDFALTPESCTVRKSSPRKGATLTGEPQQRWQMASDVQGGDEETGAVILSSSTGRRPDLVPVVWSTWSPQKQATFFGRVNTCDKVGGGARPVE